MVKALQLNAINDFKAFYRSVDALLIDDIQFLPKGAFSGGVFPLFNALLEGVSKLFSLATGTQKKSMTWKSV